MAKRRPAGDTEEDFRQTHPGFTISCDKCGSKLVYIENSLGWSPESGGWGSVDLVCHSCGNTTEIVEG